LQVVKENQILQKGDRTIDLDNEYATLVDVNIFAGDQIIVRDSEIHENRDIAGMLFDTSTWLSFPCVYIQKLSYLYFADELCDEEMETQRIEAGFRGTLLTSNGLSQVV